MADRLGIKCKAYRNTSTHGSPSWSEINHISDFTVSVTWDEADGSSRISRVKMTVKTMLGLEFSGKIKVNVADANYAAMRDASFGDGVLDILVMEDGDNATENNVGFRCDVQVLKFDVDQGMGTSLYRDFTLKPTTTDNLPELATVGGGAVITYAELAAA